MYGIHKIYVRGFSRGGFAWACWFWGAEKKKRSEGFFDGIFDQIFLRILGKSYIYIPYLL